MATVYLAHDVRHDRDVALKVLRSELAASLGPQRFLAEIRLTAKLQHPHIVPLFDSGEAGDSLYYVMPFIDGESLRDRLEREQRLSVEAMLVVARPVAQAVAYAHECGVIHRDIKPENILLSRGQPFVTDFGIARAVSVAAGERLTQTGVAVGTPAYMSPEQALGEDSLDARSDVYSLGCVIYEMLSGCPPFSGNTVQALIARRLAGPPPHLTTVPAAVDEVVRRSLATAPQDRFATAQALADALVEAARKPATPELSIVVLPFENLSPDPDNAFFADGLTEELIADLSKVRALRVISRTSAMHFKNTTKALPEIARDLNVRYVLEGSVRRAGDSLRITAQLIDSATDAHLWAEKYTSALADVFAVQEQLSRRIAEALAVTLTADEQRQLDARRIPDEQAYVMHLRARQEMQTLDAQHLGVAREMVEAALARAGPNALLLATAAEIHYWLHETWIRPEPETLDRADALVAQALDLAPDLPEAHAVRGAVALRRADSRRALVALQRAVELDPANANAHLYLSFVLAESGRTDQARKHATQTLRLDPFLAMGMWVKSFLDFVEGRFDEAPQGMERWLELSGHFTGGFWWLGVCLVYAGRRAEAQELLDSEAASTEPLLRACRAQLVAFLTGDATGLCTLLDDSAVATVCEQDKEVAWGTAAALAAGGALDESLKYLGHAIDRGFFNVRFFAEVDPYLARLRGDPRFEALMDRARAKGAEMERAL